MRSFLAVAYFGCLIVAGASFGIAATALIVGAYTDAMTAVLIGWTSAIAACLCACLGRARRAG